MQYKIDYKNPVQFRADYEKIKTNCKYKDFVFDDKLVSPISGMSGITLDKITFYEAEEIDILKPWSKPRVKSGCDCRAVCIPSVD